MIIAMSLLLLTGIAESAYSFEYELMLLHDVLENIARGDREGFLESMTWYERVDPPSVDMKILHSKIVTTLYDLANTMFSLDYSAPSACTDVNAYGNIELLMAEWAEFKHSLLPSYYAVGSPYVNDRGLYFLVRKNITVTLQHIDDTLSSMSMLTLLGHCKESPSVNVTLEPQEILAGETFTVRVENPAPAGGEALARIYIYLESTLYDTIIVELDDTASLTVEAPTFEELDSYTRQIASSLNNLTLLVLVNIQAGNAEFWGSGRAQLILRDPAVYLACTDRIVSGRNASVYIVNKESYPLNASVRLAEADVNATVLLEPGLTRIVVDSALVESPGQYTVVVSWQGTGYLLPGSRICTITVVDPIETASLSVNRVAIPPIIPIKVSGEISVAAEYGGAVPVAVILGDSVIASANVTSGFVELEASVNKILPSTDTLKVVYLVGDYERVLLETQIVVINPILVVAVAFAVATGYAGGAAGLRELIQSVTLMLHNLTRGQKNRVPGSTKVFSRIVSSLSDRVSPPRPSETLREYLERARRALPQSLYDILEAVILLYEKILYSRLGENPELVSRLRELAKKISRGATGDST